MTATLLVINLAGQNAVKQFRGGEKLRLRIFGGQLCGARNDSRFSKNRHLLTLIAPVNYLLIFIFVRAFLPENERGSTRVPKGLIIFLCYLLSDCNILASYNPRPTWYTTFSWNTILPPLLLYSARQKGFPPIHPLQIFRWVENIGGWFNTISHTCDLTQSSVLLIPCNGLWQNIQALAAI